MVNEFWQIETWLDAVVSIAERVGFIEPTKTGERICNA
jgi:hypothetical protein